MKRILLSLLVVAAVGASVTAGTMAVFSHTGYIAGNTMTSASVNLDVHNFSANKPIGTIPEYLVPGQWTQWGRAELYNTGNVSTRVYMYVDTLTGDCGKTNLRVTTGHAGGDEQARNVYNGALSGLVGPGLRVEVTGNPPFATLGANWSQAIQQTAQLDASADDSYQGTSCHWREVFVAENI